MKTELLLEKFTELATLDQFMMEIYQQCEHQVENPELQGVFSRLVADETRHIQINKDIMRAIEGAEDS